MKHNWKQKKPKSFEEERKVRDTFIGIAGAILLVAVAGLIVSFLSLNLHQMERWIIALSGTAALVIIMFFILLRLGFVSIQAGMRGPGWRLITLWVVLLASIVTFICLTV